MALKYSIIGIISSVLAFIAAFGLWVTADLYFDVLGFTGSVSIDLGMEPLVFDLGLFDITFFEGLSTSRTLMVIGAILGLVFFNKFEKDGETVKTFSWIGLATIGLYIGALIHFIVTILNEVDTSSEIDLELVVAPGIGLICWILSLILSTLALYTVLNKKNRLQKTLVQFS